MSSRQLSLVESYWFEPLLSRWIDCHFSPWRSTQSATQYDPATPRLTEHCPTRRLRIHHNLFQMVEPRSRFIFHWSLCQELCDPLTCSVLWGRSHLHQQWSGSVPCFLFLDPLHPLPSCPYIWFAVRDLEHRISTRCILLLSLGCQIMKVFGFLVAQIKHFHLYEWQPLQVNSD